MAHSGHSGFNIGRLILRLRAPIGILLVAVSAIMVFASLHVQVGTRFVDLFPSYHPYIQLNEKYQRSFGGAETLAIMIKVKDGDIFNPTTLKKIQQLNTAMDALPGVNHEELLSLGSFRVNYVEAQSGALISKPYMFPDVPTTPEGIEALRNKVKVHKDALRQLVSSDFKGALVTASFNDAEINYRTFFQDVQNIVEKYQDANNEIFVAGEPMVRGWGYHYLWNLITIILISLTIIVIVHYYGIRGIARWWAPLMTGTISAFWGMGFTGLIGYQLDPIMLVIPFILTARDVSHGIQWQRRFYSEIEKTGGDVHTAVMNTTNLMLPPGLVSILADIFGIILVSYSGIPVLHHIALTGAVWVASSLLMVFVFQPIVMSYLPPPPLEGGVDEHLAGGLEGFIDRFVSKFIEFPVHPGKARTIILWGAAAFIVGGLLSGVRAEIGYRTVGTPLYKADSKVNKDIQAIAQYFPVDEGWVVLETPSYPDPQSILGSDPLRIAEELRSYLRERDPNVLQVISFASDIEKPFNQMFHYAHPKYLRVPDTVQLSGNLWYLYLTGTAPGEMERFIPNQQANATCLRVLLRDHTYTTLTNVLDEIEAFTKSKGFVRKSAENNSVYTGKGTPNLNNVEIHFMGGIAGLYAAANEVLKYTDFFNLTLTLLAVGVCCAIEFRSVSAGLLFILASVLGNFGAFMYMNARNLTLTIDTIPVVSLGIGLGIDYGIYTMAAIRDEIMGGKELTDGITTAMRGTGQAVLNTLFVMIGGLSVWLFSPVDFHVRMASLLIFLMTTNAITGVIILPSFVSAFKPKFITRYIESEDRVGGGGGNGSQLKAAAGR